MLRHKGIKADYFPAHPDNPTTEFRVFATYKNFIITACFFKSFAANEDIAPKTVRFADSPAPFNIPYPVINRVLRVHLFPESKHSSDSFIIQSVHRFMQPFSVKKCVRIQKLDKW